MFKILKNKKLAVLTSLLFATVGNFAMVLTPFYLGSAIDAMLDKNVQFVVVKENLVLVLLLYIISFIFVWLSNYISFVVGSNVVYNLRNKVQEKLFVLPQSYLDQHAHGKLTNLISSDSDLILDGIFQLLSQILGGLVVIVTATIFMLQIHVGMSFVVFLTIPFVYLSSYWVSKYSIKHFRTQQQLSGKLNGYVNQVIQNHELILNMNYQEEIQKVFENLNSDLNKTGRKAQFVSSLSNPTTRVVQNVSYGLLGLVGAMSIIKGNLSLGLFTSFLSYSTLFSKPFNELSSNLSQVFSAKASLDLITAFLNEKEIDDQGTQSIQSGGEIKFESVNFSYSKKQSLIQDLNLDVASKQKIAIVGPTGSGKSTLINILMRYYDVDSGNILIDGVNLYDLTRENLYHNIALVLQDPWLFEGSILDNIRYGKKDATVEEVMQAAQKADIHDTIMRMDKGYNTKINYGGQNISKGQMQLLTIARALIMEAPILILDEATSSIDSLTEKRIQSVFTQIMESQTSFFIAHRLHTVMDSDLILVMRNGHLVEKGSHEELMGLNGFYKELFESQF